MIWKKDKGNIFPSFSLPQFGLLAILFPPAWLAQLNRRPARLLFTLPRYLPGPAQSGWQLPPRPPFPPPQPLTARPHVSAPSSSSSNRPHAPGEIAAELRPLLTRRGSVPPLAPGRFKSAPSRLRPSLLPPALTFAFAVHRGSPQPSPRGRRDPPSSPPRGQPSSSRQRLRFSPL